MYNVAGPTMEVGFGEVWTTMHMLSRCLLTTVMTNLTFMVVLLLIPSYESCWKIRPLSARVMHVYPRRACAARGERACTVPVLCLQRIRNRPKSDISGVIAALARLFAAIKA